MNKGQFKKGYPRSEEWKRKMSIIMTGRKATQKTKEKIRLAHFGMKYSEERNRKLSETQKRIGNRPPSFLGKKHSFKTRKLMSNNIKKAGGRIISPEQRKNISNTLKKFFENKENHWNWKGGIRSKTTIEFSKIRASSEYKTWRNHVFQRDNYTCQGCGDKEGRLEIDHELPFQIYPDLRFEILNGRVLCRNCHKKTPSYGSKIKIYLKEHNWFAYKGKDETLEQAKVRREKNSSMLELLA